MAVYFGLFNEIFDRGLQKEENPQMPEWWAPLFHTLVSVSVSVRLEECAFHLAANIRTAQIYGLIFWFCYQNKGCLL